MRVTVRLFARLRDLAGTSELAADVPPGATIADVWAGARRSAPGAGAVRRLAVGGAQPRIHPPVDGGGRGRRDRVHAAGVGRLSPPDDAQD